MASFAQTQCLAIMYDVPKPGAYHPRPGPTDNSMVYPERFMCPGLIH